MKFKKSAILILSIIIIFSGVRFISGYFKVNQNKYGIEYNSERKKLGIRKIPESFELTEKPINSFLDYFTAIRSYSLEYVTKKKLDSGLVKIRIDVNENHIGIIREYSFYKKGNDTIVDIYNYYEK